MNDEGNWVALESFDSYNEAELNIDGYFNMYPNAYVDIVASLMVETNCLTAFTLKPPPLFNYDYHHRTYLYAQG
jgi:hypothetical protein